MKKILLLEKAAVAACLLFAGISPGKAQGGQPEQPAAGQAIAKLPMDPDLRYGKLDNGMTYYIRHNETPKERADFYIVQNVGSMQEEDNQRGLAHFLEHMAFNGTKNFPDKTGIQNFVEGLGMRMGENLNAYTSFDETVYMMTNAPVSQENAVDSCLLVLHDWSAFLLLTDEAIEKERGVIREEWRTRNTAQSRMWEQQLPKMYPDCKYGERLPIGSIDVINNFKGDELRAYYKKWYRPDLQGVIVVGDIDVDEVEKTVKAMFADIPAPVNPAKKEKALVPDNASPIVSIAKDKEMTNTMLTIYYKHDKQPEAMRGTIVDFVTGYAKTVVSMIMSERFSDIMQKPNKPFAMAYASDGDYFVSNTKGAWTSAAMVKDGEISRAMKALVEETEKAKKYGFTEAEYNRAKDNILKSYESLYNDRDKQDNSSFANEYVRHFTNGEAIPGIEIEYELVKQIAPSFPVEGINEYVRKLFDEKDPEHNVVISLSGPDKDGVEYPSESELLEMFRAASKENVLANEEETINKALISELPAPGKIVGEKEDPLFGTTLYTLSNGVRVAVKHTDYKKDEIKMTATSPGGTTLFGDEKDIHNIKVINNALMLGGLGDFSAASLRKALAGKMVSCSIGLGDSNENVNGSASPSDLKTLFELIYLEFTGMRTDDDAYASFVESVKAQLDGLRLNPMVAFGDTLTETIYNGNPKNSRLKSSDFDNIDYPRMIDMYKERYGDASDFVFTFVGNIDKDTIRPLLEQYLATLPALGRKEKGDESRVTPFREGVVTRRFTKKLETPKTSIGLMYTGKMPYNLKNVILAQLLEQILDLVYAEKVRKDEGASYFVQTTVGLYDFPEGRMSIQVFFDTDPDKADKMLDIVKSELKSIGDNGPREADLAKSRSNILKSRSEAMQMNDFWIDILDTYYSKNFDAHTDYEPVMGSITIGDIKDFAHEFLKQGNLVEIVMSPDENSADASE